MNYTKLQIEQYRAYEEVRQSGLYNMFSRDAMHCTGLTKDEYTFVMKNYSELKEACEASDADRLLLSQVDKS